MKTKIDVVKSHSTISKLLVRDGEQIVWKGVGQFQTQWLKNFFATLKQTGIKELDMSIGDFYLSVEYPRGIMLIDRTRMPEKAQTTQEWEPVSAKHYSEYEAAQILKRAFEDSVPMQRVRS